MGVAEVCGSFQKMSEDGSSTYYNRVFGGRAEVMHINTSYGEHVGSCDGGISCNRHYHLNTPPQEMEPTQGMKRNN